MFKHNAQTSLRDVEQNRAFVFCVVGPRPERHARIDSKAPSFISDPRRSNEVGSETQPFDNSWGLPSSHN